MAIAYTFVSLIPFMDQKFKKYQFESPQFIKRTVGEQISKELLFDSFVSSLESAKIYPTIKKAVCSFLDKDKVA